MAERRMFSKTVVNSARFLRMPQTSRLLYYDLGMAADDDGVVEAFTVIRTTGAAEDDLRVLASKGFITVLNEDLVSLIVDWNKNNYIQKDRYHPSIYSELLVKITDAAELEPLCIQTASKMDTEIRLGKDRIGQISQVKTSASGGEYEGNRATDCENAGGGSAPSAKMQAAGSERAAEADFETKRENALRMVESMTQIRGA